MSIVLFNYRKSMCPNLPKEELFELQKLFFSDARIASKLGVSRQYIGSLRKKYDMPSTKTNINSRNKSIAFEFTCRNNVRRISRKYNLSESHLYKIKRTYEKNNEP